MSGEAELQELLELIDKQKVLLEKKDAVENWAAEYAQGAEEIRRLIQRVTEKSGKS
jgi:hypothetical protein